MFPRLPKSVPGTPPPGRWHSWHLTADVTPAGKVRTAFDPTLCGEAERAHFPPGVGKDAPRPRRPVEPEGPALTSGKAPSAKTISSDVFPQPPSPTRTTLTDRAPGGASSPEAWAAFITGQRREGQAQRSGGLGAGGAGMWKGRGGAGRGSAGGGWRLR